MAATIGAPANRAGPDVSSLMTPKRQTPTEKQAEAKRRRGIRRTAMNAINSQVVPVQKKVSIKSKIALAAVAALGRGGLTASAQAHDRFDDRVRYEERDGRVWVAEPAYRTVCEKVWVEPVYKMVCEQVWVEPVV